MISNDLFTKVMGFGYKKARVSDTWLMYVPEMSHDNSELGIGTCELALKCKRYIETKTIYYIIVGFEVVFVTTDMWAEGGLYFEKEFKEGDETQRITDACEWALKQLKEK